MRERGEWCDVFKLRTRDEWQFPVLTGQKRRKRRCPTCGRRLTPCTIPDRSDGGVAFYRLPQHRMLVKADKRRGK